MKGDGIRADFTVTGSGAEQVSADDQRARRRRRRRTTPPTCRTSPTSCSPRRRSSWRPTGPATTRSARALYPVARHALGAHRDRRGVVRRPRPEDGRPRGRPRARPEVDRLAPDREGPVARARREVRRPLAARSARTYAAGPARQHQDPRRPAPEDRASPSTRSPTARAGCSRRSRSGKVTGEEEYWSRTDLWDFQANVDGARVGVRGRGAAAPAEGPRPRRGPSTRGSPRCRTCSTQQRAGDGFTTYDQVSPEEIKALADAVNALSEPLSRLTAAVLS